VSRNLYFSAFLLVACVSVGTLAIWGQTQRPTSESSVANRRETVSRLRQDPYKNYRYRILDTATDQYVAGFSQVSQNPTPTPPKKIQGFNKFEDITLERGVTQDNGFAQWLSQSQTSQFKDKDMVLETFDETGKKSAARKLTGCQVIELQSIPNLDGGANSRSVQVVKLRCRQAQ